MKKSKGTDVNTIITEKFISAIESGVNPFWIKPFANVAPANFGTGKRYNGINVLILKMMDAGREQLYGTFNQIKNMGGTVKKGAKGRQVVFWNFVITKDGKRLTDKQVKALSAAERKACKQSAFLRYYVVFNIHDTEGIDKAAIIAKHKGSEYTGAESVERCERWIKNTGVKLTSAAGAAYYSPLRDTVNVPEKDQFLSTEAYYGTMFHELVHWTGHETRCKRDLLGGVMDKKAYSKEELIAELGASFLCAEFQMFTEEEERNSTAYLQSWLKPLQNDTRLIVSAAGKAQKAVDYMHGLQPNEATNAMSA